jgi:hypothetical protein
MKPNRAIFVLAIIASAVLTAMAEPADTGLPEQFAGWHISGSIKTSHDPATADAVNAALLKEYGFTDLESATYVRDDGRKLTIKAARFPDASGAYGAFTFYRTPEMQKETIGDQGASLNERVLFYRGSILVDAVFDKLSAMSAAELRELSHMLPLPAGGAQNAPPVLAYVPHAASEKGATKYAVGPVGLRKINAPLPAELVDFSTGAEVAMGTYGASGGDASLMLISYPTPQVAAAHLRPIEAAQEQNNKAPGSVTGIEAVQIFSKRTGPIVVVVAGPVSRSEAQSWLSSVNYEANVTWNERNPFDKKNNIGDIVWNALLLCGILMAISLIAGLAFGGVRIVAKRFFPNQVFDRPEGGEFISLHLQEGRTDPSKAKVSSSIEAG